jgi:hypothetical protein
MLLFVVVLIWIFYDISVMFYHMLVLKSHVRIPAL